MLTKDYKSLIVEWYLIVQLSVRHSVCPLSRDAGLKTFCGVESKAVARKPGGELQKFRKGDVMLLENCIIKLKDLVVDYDDERVIDGLDLEIRDKEFVTLLGPSGCGKTTTLRVIGGFVEPSAGEVFFDGKDIKDLPPHKRQVNTVFQRYALFTHLNVYENVAFGLRIQKLSEDEIRQRVTEMLRIVNLSGYERRSIDQLSGGQQQRVAIARALVNQPRVLLLDEPLGALDLKLRKDMQIELKRIQKETEITFIYVTHDQEEALTMSDTVVVMNQGVIQQIGSPEDIYNEPKNAFVADFIGESNILPGIMKRDFLVEFGGHEFTCVDKGFAPNEQVDVVVRPEDVKIVPQIAGQLTGVVESIIFKGVHFEISIDAMGHRWIVHSTQSEEVGAVVGMSLTPDDIHIMKKMEE
ncbi:Spermidine/putrescine import ATP-binding protein PotA [Anaerotruncus sp. 2789STDY5834896]|nr:Spermidine/putrescine import ATP-binding protein PotA [uncultured Anaerotruncus sp.]